MNGHWRLVLVGEVLEPDDACLMLGEAAGVCKGRWMQVMTPGAVLEDKHPFGKYYRRWVRDETKETQ